jgi:hypothetical protein
MLYLLRLRSMHWFINRIWLNCKLSMSYLLDWRLVQSWAWYKDHNTHHCIVWASHNLIVNHAGAWKLQPDPASRCHYWKSPIRYQNCREVSLAFRMWNTEGDGTELLKCCSYFWIVFQVIHYRPPVVGIYWLSYMVTQFTGCDLAL